MAGKKRERKIKQPPKTRPQQEQEITKQPEIKKEEEKRRTNQMPEIYDPKTKRMIVAPTPAAGTKVKEGLVYMTISQSTFDTLKGFATEDGFDFTADTENGSKMKATNAVKKYMLLAINEFIAAREGAGEDEPEANEEEAES